MDVVDILNNKVYCTDSGPRSVILDRIKDYETTKNEIDVIKSKLLMNLTNKEIELIINDFVYEPDNYGNIRMIEQVKKILTHGPINIHRIGHVIKKNYYLPGSVCDSSNNVIKSNSELVYLYITRYDMWVHITHIFEIYLSENKYKIMEYMANNTTFCYNLNSDQVYEIVRTWYLKIYHDHGGIMNEDCFNLFKNMINF
jgi:hypothetical protein